MTKSSPLDVSEACQKALDHFEKNKAQHLEDLKALVRIPSISFANFPEANVKKSADAVASQMKSIGLQNIQIISLPAKGDEVIHPYVYGEWLGAPGKPTILLYAHHDVQPIGDETLWKSEPFEPTIREGRMYARGSADDKAGISVHLAAIASFLKTNGTLPLNVKVIIEGEEEIGSTHLPEFVTQYRELLKCDAMVLTDTMNFDTGIPALTVTLRGLVSLDVEMEALDHSLHSGLWGGPIPDPAMALSKVLASLTDDEGRLQVPGFWEMVKPLTEKEVHELSVLPFDESDFRKQSSLKDGIPLRPGKTGSVEAYRQMWREPSLAINAMEVSSRKQAGNIIPAKAWARVGVRLVPNMDAEKCVNLLEQTIRERTPWGVKVKCRKEGVGKPWATDPQGKAFDAAREALTRGYGKTPVMMGMGGTIPFVDPLASALGGVPALLMGVEDPYTNAHSENESLHLGDWEKAIKSAIYFYDLYGNMKR